MFFYIIIALLIILIITLLLLFFIDQKIKSLEYFIIQNFKEKNNLIPSIFEVTRNHISKHLEVFEELIKLKKQDFAENSSFDTIKEKNKTFSLIHKELNFIFRVANKNQKLNKDWKFLYIRDLIIDKSNLIWENLNIYKRFIKIYNKIIIFKNLTIIWLFIPINKKDS